MLLELATGASDAHLERSVLGETLIPVPKFTGHRVVSLLLALAILLVAPRKATSVEPIPGTCTIDTAWRNTDRYVQGPVYAECYGDPINCWPFAGHTVPWGNWGVNSNAGNKNDTHQFWGHEDIDGNYQWNSCTEDAQSSNQGAQRYAFYRGQAAWVPCSEAGLGGTVWTFTNQYMEMWELDGCDEDEDRDSRVRDCRCRP